MKSVLTILFLCCCSILIAQEETIIPITSTERSSSDTSDVEDVQVFTIVQEMPEFPGGKDELFKFISEEIRYPEEAMATGLQGVIYLQLLITENGCIDTTAINVLRGVDPILDNEAIRVVKQMPCWTPGYQRGKAVRVYYNLPFRFTLNE